MQIIINVADKVVKGAVENMLEGNIYENYSEEARDIAGVPKKAALLKAVMADEKFLAALAKRIEGQFDIEDYLYDYVWDVPCKIVGDLQKKCDLAYEEAERRAEAQSATDSRKLKEAEEEAAIKRTIKALEKAGYKIVKA